MSCVSIIIGMDSRLEARRRDFKKVVDSADARRRREGETVQIRKLEKEEQMQRRRRISDEFHATENFTIENLPDLASALLADEIFAVSRGLRGIRRLLSVQNVPPVAQVRAIPGVLNRLCEILKLDAQPDLQFESSWALTNIASGKSEDTAAVVELGALPVFLNHLILPDPRVREQAIWALGNIAGDCADFRDSIVSAGAAERICEIIQKSESEQLTETAVWALSNFCRGKPFCSVDAMLVIIPTLFAILSEGAVTAKTTADALWSLSYLCDGPPDRAMKVVRAESEILFRAVHFLQNTNLSIQSAAMRAVGNLTSGSSEVTKKLVIALPAIRELFRSSKKSIRKEAVWAVSNFLADSPAMITAVAEHEFFPILREMAAAGGDSDIKREVAWCYCNAANAARADQIRWLWEEGDVLAAISHLLTARDTKTVKTALEAIRVIFTACRVSGQLAAATLRFELADGLAKLEDLQEDESQEIYDAARFILCEFFETEEFEDQNFVENADKKKASFNF